MLIGYKDGFTYKEFVSITFENPNREYFIIQLDNYSEVFQLFFEEFINVAAAGGVVQNQNDEILMIYRNSCWDLPKGKVEEGESIRLAAVREVEEECGLVGPEITDEISSTYHTYERDEKKYLKKTYWFAMSYEKEHALVPQIEEGITKAEWINKNNLQTYTVDTYGSIKSVIN
jgi:8-oxo-dGTP pyrophosphatase MutT (NUDIX family)